MKLRWNSGYTIIEVMIFLAITGVLFLSAVLSVGGQQSKVQFNQSMRDLEATLRTTMTDATNGLYNNAGLVNCRVNASGDAYLSTDASDQTGKNIQCIFLGKAIQLGTDGADGDQNIRTYTLIGRREITNSGVTQDVQSVSQARPRVDTSSSYQSVKTDQVRFGAHIKGCSGTAQSPVIVFTPSLASIDSTTGGTATSSQSMVAYSLTTVPCGSDQNTTISALQNTANYATPLASAASPWTACFESSDKKQTALFTIGLNGDINDVKLEFNGC